MISIRSGSGLGDAVYLQAIARHLVLSQSVNHLVEVCSDYPDVFRPLGSKVKVSPFRRQPISHVAHYAGRRFKRGTTQFEDCCISAGIHSRVDLRLDWSPVGDWRAELSRFARPLIAVQLPRAPFGDRPDRYGIELLPEFAAVQRAIDWALLRGATVIQVGGGKPLFEYQALGADYANKTSVVDLLDILSLVDGFLGYVSYMVPLAEALRKPALAVWSRRGSLSSDNLIATIKPKKIIHGEWCRAVYDDSPHIEEAVDALCQRAACSVAA